MENCFKRKYNINVRAKNKVLANISSKKRCAKQVSLTGGSYKLGKQSNCFDLKISKTQFSKESVSSVLSNSLPFDEFLWNFSTQKDTFLQHVGSTFPHLETLAFRCPRQQEIPQWTPHTRTNVPLRGRNYRPRLRGSILSYRRYPAMIDL